MKKLALFPYDRETSSIARYRKFILDYELTRIVAFKGWGYKGKDASNVDHGSLIGMTISENFEEAIEEVDAVLFVEGDTEVKASVLKQKLELAYKEGKEIIMTEGLKNKLELEAELQDKIKILGKTSTSKKIGDEEEKLYKSNTPIIAIYGAGKYTNKFEVQLEVSKYFMEQGYKVLQIGSKSYSALFGVEEIPKEIYSQSLGMARKVYLFNHYIHNLERMEKPDLIVISVPGGIMPLCSECSNGFGEMAHIVSSAIQVDIGIFSTYYFENISYEYLEEVKEYCKYALRAPIDYVNIANTKWNYEKELKEDVYLPIENKRIEQDLTNKNLKVKDNEIRIFNVLGEESTEPIYSQMLEELSGIEVVR